MIKRWLLRIVFLAILGYVARRLMTPEEPNKQKVGRFLGRFTGATA
jgi:hypothetical protein